MFSTASSCHDHRRLRMSAVAVLVTLLLAPLGAPAAQDSSKARRGGTQDGPAAGGGTQDGPAAGGGTQDGPAAVRDSTAQRVFDLFLKAVVAAARARDSLRKDSVSRQPPQARMPNVVGMDTMTAINVLRGMMSRRLVRSVTYSIVPSDRTSIPVNKIEEQQPAAGTLVREVVGIRLTLGGIPRPPDSVSVPRVIGLLDDEAERTLRAAKLVGDRLEVSVTSPDRIGRVTVQKPESGQRLAVGGSVSIWIGRDARVVMPKVTSLTLAAARERLREVGIERNRIRWDSAEATTSIGTVVRQRPAAGTVLLSTTQIALTQAVRSPPPAVRPPPAVTPPAVARIPVMPMVVGRDSATAIRMLGAAGLRNYRIVLPVDTIAEDVVQTQSPDAGRQVRAESLVVLTLQARPPAVAETGPGLRYRDWLRWFAATLAVLAAAAASTVGARTIWPPPKIVPRLRLQPQFAEVVDASGSLVEVSVSLRSHVEHQRSVLDLTGSSLD